MKSMGQRKMKKREQEKGKLKKGAVGGREEKYNGKEKRKRK